MTPNIRYRHSTASPLSKVRAFICHHAYMISFLALALRSHACAARDADQDRTVKPECIIVVSPARVAVMGISENERYGRHSVITHVDIRKNRVISQFVFPFLHFELLRTPDLLEKPCQHVLVHTYDLKGDDIRSAIREVDLITGCHTVLYSPDEDFLQVPMTCLSGRAVLLRSAESTGLVLCARDAPATCHQFASGDVPRGGFCVSSNGNYVFHGRDVPGLWRRSLKKNSGEGLETMSPGLDKYIHRLWMSGDDSRAAFTDGKGVLSVIEVRDTERPTKVSGKSVHTLAWSPGNTFFVFVHLSSAGVQLKMWDGEAVRVISGATKSHISFLPTSNVVFVAKNGSLCQATKRGEVTVIVPGSKLTVIKADAVIRRSK